MPSHRKINLDSPRQGIIKSQKHIDDRSKAKHLKLNFITSRKSNSTESKSGSLQKNLHFTEKENPNSARSNLSVKKGCLKNADKSSLSLKRIISFEQGQVISSKSLRSTKSIKFNKQANVHIYVKSQQKQQSRRQIIKIMANKNPVFVQQSENQNCCVIY